MRAPGFPGLTLSRPHLSAIPPRHLAALRLVAGLALAAGVVAALETSSGWQALQAGVVSLGFDPARAALICAWIGCFGMALLAGALTARPWPSAFAATGYLALTYVWPWASHAVSAPPVLFGARERLDALALLQNVSVIVAVGFLVGLPAAAAGRQLSELVGQSGGLGNPPPLLRALLLGAVTAAFLVSALGVESVLRYGPAHRVYHPAPTTGSAHRGQILTRLVHSRAQGADIPVAVYLPPSYQQSLTRYPVVYLLHGHPGGYHDWVNMGIGSISDAGIAARSIAEAIVVVPDGNGRTTRPAQWADSRDGLDRMESSVLEVVAQVDQEYRTLAGPHHRVIAGLSDGGYGAANIALRHPDIFGMAISLSGYFKAEGLAFGDDRAYMRANSPASIVRDQPASRTVRLILVAGTSDGQYLRNTEAFAAELDRWAMPHALVRLPGGHESSVWTSGLVIGLQQLKPQMQDRSI
jgi:enterochelin esterase-like enzyme